MYGLLAMIVVTLGLGYILTVGHATFTIRVVHVVEQPEIPETIQNNEEEATESDFDAILASVQESINNVTGVGGKPID